MSFILDNCDFKKLCVLMDSYDVYNSISVDDVRDMVKDITEDKLIIQYCS